jgi:hypothetical protein
MATSLAQSRKKQKESNMAKSVTLFFVFAKAASVLVSVLLGSATFGLKVQAPFQQHAMLKML